VFLLSAGLAQADVLPHRDVAAINVEVAAVFVRIDTAQAAHRADPRLRYVQLLPAALKRDGSTPTRPDLDTKTPNDRSVGMRNLGFTDGDAFRADYVVEEYFTPPRSPVRHGYVIHAEVEIGGVIWRRSRAFGPEARNVVDSDTAWYTVE